MEQVLAILDGEEAYASRLQRYINSQASGLTVAAFTDEQSLNHYMGKHNVGLLVCESRIFQSMEHPPDCKTVLLSGQSCVKETSSGLPVIFKFQSAQEILDEILGFYRQIQEEIPEKTLEHGTAVCTVCSPAGSGTETSFAFALARKKSKNGRVLFLALDPLYQPELSDGSRNEALTKAIYYIKQKSAGLEEKLNQLVVKNERVDCLYGVGHWADISECMGQEMVELLEAFSLTKRYSLIVVAAGQLTDAAAGCMGYSDQIIMIAGNDKQAAPQEKEFLQQASFRDSGFPEKLLRIGQGDMEEMLAEAANWIHV